MESHLSIHKLVGCCKHLGVPLDTGQVDTEQMLLRLPAEKLQRVHSPIKEFLGIPSALKGDLESLLGTPACVKSSKAREEFCETSD